MFLVIASYRVAAGRADDVREILSRHSKASEAEPGCLGFKAHQSLDDPECFVLYETYIDREAFEAHRLTEHFKTNVEQTLVPLLVERTWKTYGPAL